MIHASVAYRDSKYRPKANFIGYRSRTPQWQDLIGEGRSGKYLKSHTWKDYLEKDLFDLRDTPTLISELDNDNDADHALGLLHKLNFMEIPRESTLL